MGRTRKKILNDSEDIGLSLVEVILALTVLALLYVAFMGVITNSFANVRASRNRFVAVEEARSVLNDIRSATEFGVPEGVQEAYPEGELLPPRTALPEEKVTVAYGDPEAPVFFVTVRVQWLGVGGREMFETLTTGLSAN